MNKILEWLLVSSFLYSFAAGLLGPIYAVFVGDIGGDLLTAGTAFALFTIICGISILLLSAWENRAKHKEKILVASRILMLIGFVGYLFVNNPLQLFLVQMILGAALALGTPVFDAIYSRNVERNKEVFQWGMWEGQYQISLGISAIVGAFIAQNFGFKWLFILMTWIALFSVITMIIMALQKQWNKPKSSLHQRRWAHNASH